MQEGRVLRRGCLKEKEVSKKVYKALNHSMNLLWE
jgi:hypothetical protein